MVQQPLLIALVDADARRRKHIEALAISLGFRSSGFAAVPEPGLREHRLVLVTGCGNRTIAAARRAFPLARIVVADASAAQREAVAAFRAGADDFAWLGGGDAELAELLLRHLASPCRGDAASEDDGGLIGTSAAMGNLRAFIRKLAPAFATVLVTGDTGTGKDVVAVSLHRQSRRASKPLVAINCAAIPDALLEGELFGYERGAFSGAHAAYPGKLRLANGGTLLLDELGELSLAGQAKLLRAIETREAWPLGARSPIRFDVRIIALTNRDLHAEVAAGRFREDLFYRLAVSQLHIPSLRERPCDVAPLARHLLGQLAEERGAQRTMIDAQALSRLEAHDWPGNGRELRNALEVALINADGPVIRAGDLPEHIAVRQPGPKLDIPDERSQLIAALGSAHGNKSRAALTLNCSRMTLYRRMQRHGLAEDAALAL